MVSGMYSPKPSKTFVTVRLFFRRANPTGNVSIENSFGSMIVHFPKKSPFQLDIFCTSFYSKGLLPRLRAIFEVRRHKAEINHVTGDTNFLVLGLPRKNTILTIHDCGLLDGKNLISKWILWAFWLKLPVKHCRFLTVVSEATKADVIRYTNCPAEKIRVIPTVIKSEFKQSPKTFSKKYPIFLHIGNSPNKNLERHAAALRGIPCCFHIIGQISEEQIILLNDYKIDYKISVNLSEEDMLKAYESADILLFCSLIEGFGMPIVEAQTVGRVVITSNISSMPEVAGQGACFVNPLSIEDIRAGIESVLNNDSYRISLIEKGFENTQRFDPKTVAKQYNQLYRELFES